MRGGPVAENGEVRRIRRNVTDPTKHEVELREIVTTEIVTASPDTTVERNAEPTRVEEGA